MGKGMPQYNLRRERCSQGHDETFPGIQRSIVANWNISWYSPRAPWDFLRVLREGIGLKYATC